MKTGIGKRIPVGEKGWEKYAMLGLNKGVDTIWVTRGREECAT